MPSRAANLALLYVYVRAQEPSSWKQVGEIDCLAEGARCFGCHTLNYCNGHGRCEQRGGPGSPFANCRCDPGWGGDAFCTEQTCPLGKAQSDMPTSTIEAHGLQECSNAGFCDRLTGKCQCFLGFKGAACQSKSCPTGKGNEDCSGKGLCLTMRQLARIKDALPLNDGLTSVNATEDLTNLPMPGDPVQNMSIRYDGAMERNGPGGPTYDQHLNRACLCDSSWEVGLGAGERQQAEFYGPDCSLQRCPSGDDPMTLKDETNCTGVVAEGGRGVGRPGNLCHVSCANRGTCKDGLCKCFKGFRGANCAEPTTQY